ncbi:MAG TPA: hypothetical protein DCS21_08050, partial [Gammaproteobacteria bacterium]|nr:hypothetical protein [Gammaproteobacteria bacterium]
MSRSRPLFLSCVLLIAMGGTSAALAARPNESLQPLPDFRKLVKQNEASVVNISSTQTPSRRATRTPGFPELPGSENPYLEFFKRFFQERPELPGD